MKKLLILSFALLSACASNPNKVEKLTNVDIQKKGTLTNSTDIGINSNNEAVVQSVTSVQNELNSLVWWNNNKEMEMNSEYAQLKSCRKDLSDPRLGGADRVKVPQLKNKWNESVSERMGLMNDDLVVVKEQYLKDKIKLEKEKSQYYDDMTALIKEAKDDCEVIMGNARLKAGLPSKRFQGQVSITPDGKVSQVIKRHEHNLDDAFEIKKDNALDREQLAEDRAFDKELALEKAKNSTPIMEYWGQ